MREVAVRAENLGMRYGKKWALTHLDLEVYRGEVFGFLGPNGAGKTTTLKLFTGLMRPSSGRSSIFGEDSLDPVSHRHIGYAPEDPFLYDSLTPDELLSFYCRLQGIPEGQREAEVTWALASVGLTEVRHLRIKAFSKGMKGRLAVAQALLGRPPLLFLDEPTSGQDPLARMAIRDLILWYRDNGGTVFLSSHILTDVERVCDRVAIMNRGRLVRLGSVEELGAGAEKLTVEADPIPPSFLEELSRRGKGYRPVFGGVEVDGVGREEVPELARMLVERGSRLYGLHLRGRGLEELFVEAVESDGDSHAGL